MVLSKGSALGISALITWDDIDFVKSATVRNEPLICLIVKNPEAYISRQPNVLNLNNWQWAMGSGQ